MGNNRIKDAIPLILLSLILFSSFAPVITSGWEGEGSGEVVIELMTGTIIVSTNLEAADFTIAGPKQIEGQGSFNIFSNMLVGVYTITYKDAIGYDAPRLETKTLTEEGKIQFIGEYNKVLTTTDASLQEVIKEYTQKETSITIDGEQYYIVTLKGYIHPEILQPTEYAPSNPSGIWNVYVDANWQPVANEEIAQKIYIVDKANYKLHCLPGGSPDGIEKNMEGIDGVLDAHKELDRQEDIDRIAEQVFKASADLLLIAGAIEVGAGKAASEILRARMVSILREEALRMYFPKDVSIGTGLAFLSKAKNEYNKAYEIAVRNPQRITDHKTAEDYLSSLYTAYFFEVYGTGLVLPANRIDKSELAIVLGWGAEYIIYKAEWIVDKITNSKFRAYHKFYDIASSIIKGFTEPIIMSLDGIEAILSTTSEVEWLLEKSIGLPVYYTLALAHRDITELKEFPLEPYIREHLASPAELRVYDSESKVTGIVSGDIKIEIPNSFYHNNTVIIFFPSDLYKHEIAGIANGSYRFMIDYVGNKTTSFVVSDVPISVNATHQYTIEGTSFNQTITKVTLKIDSDGDKVFERSIDLFNAKEISTVEIETEFFRTFFFILLVILSILSCVYLARRR